MEFSVTLDKINSFYYVGERMTLPSDIMRYYEFGEVAVFWLRNGGRENHVVGVKFSQEGGVNRSFLRRVIRLFFFAE